MGVATPVVSLRLVSPGRAVAAARRPHAFLRKCFPARMGFRRGLVIVGSTTPFTEPRPLNPAQQVMENVPAPLSTLAGALLVAGAATAGVALGGLAPEALRPVGKAVGAAALAAAAGYGAHRLQGMRKAIAAVQLHNALVGRDPAALTRAEVASLGARYGVDLPADFKPEVKALYDAYLTAVLPPGDEPLAGWEPEAVKAFKDALGLEDADAADVHLEVARRTARSRLETSERDAATGEKRAFDKIVYLSQQVFGEAKARFLLPWKRLFGVTDSQIVVAVRNNAAGLYRARLAALVPGAAPDADALAAARAAQRQLSLSDDAAAAAWADAAGARALAGVRRASALLKARTRVKDLPGVAAEITAVVDYAHALASLAASPRGVAGDLAAGVGPLALPVGDAKAGTGVDMSDLKDLFTSYLDTQLTGGVFSDELVAATDTLRVLFGLGPKEARALIAEASARAYRAALRSAVQGGGLDAAPSKAAYLQDLCERLRFEPADAARVHEELYLQKLEAVLEGRRLSEDDAAQLARMRVLLCLPADMVKAANVKAKGRIFREVLVAAVGTGIDGFSEAARIRVRSARDDLRLEPEVALELLAEVSRKVMMTHVREARNKSNRLEAAKELKRLVFFSNIIVAPLLEDLTPKTEAEKAAEAVAEVMKQAAAEAKAEEAAEEAAKAAAGAKGDRPWASLGKEPSPTQAPTPVADGAAPAESDPGAAPQLPASLRKTSSAGAQAAEGERLDGGAVMKAQKEITLAGDLDVKERQELYRMFLLYCMTGDAVALPMGTEVATERDQTEFARLSQLGDVLGLNALLVADVHRSLAETAFRNTAQQVLGDGSPLTKEKSEYLKETQGQLGLSDDAAATIIKGVSSQRLIAGMQAQVSGGKLTIAELRSLRAAGVDPTGVVGDEMRMSLFRKEVERLLSDGTGCFDPRAVVDDVAPVVAIAAAKAEAVVAEIGRDRKRNALVGAVSFLRQKKQEDTVKQVHNLVACTLAAGPGAAAMPWPVKEEVQDLYSVYVLAGASDDQLGALQATVGITDAQAAQLREVVAAGGFELTPASESSKAIF